MVEKAGDKSGRHQYLPKKTWDNFERQIEWGRDDYNHIDEGGMAADVDVQDGRIED